MLRSLLQLAFFFLVVMPAAADSGSRIRSDETNIPLTQLKREAKADELPAVASTASRPVAATAADHRYWVVVRATSREDRTAIAGAGMAIEEEQADRVAGTAHIKTIHKLQQLGFQVMFQTSLTKMTKDFPAPDKAYHSYDRMVEALQSLAKGNEHLVSLFSIGQSVQGRDIWCLRFNTTQTGNQPSDKPGVLFIGDHHAREHLSVEVPLKIAEHLAAHQDDPTVKKLLESRDIYIIPMLNPDGAEFDVATGDYKWHRKNMRINPDQQIGVDLNRNCDFIFGGEGSSGDTYSETYHGPSAFSEPETQAFKAFLEARANIKALNSFHSYAALVMYPWGGKDGPVENPEDLKAFKAMAEAMAGMTGFAAQQSNEMYVATGDCADWAYAALKIFAFTTELGPVSGGGFYPGAAEIEKEAPGNIEAALYLLEYADDPHRAMSAAFAASKVVS